MACWCSGKRKGARKHRARDEKPCPESLADERQYQRGRHVPGVVHVWRPGSPIEMPEVDPL